MIITGNSINMKLLPFYILFFVSNGFAQTDSAGYYFLKGKEEKAARRYLPAYQFFSKAIQYKPSFTAAMMEQAAVSLELQKSEKAIQLYNRVLELEPGNQAAAGKLMELYYQHHQYSRARQLAIQCKACSYAEKINAISAYQEEDYSAAIKGLTSFLTKYPADAEAAYILARSYLDTDDYTNAISWYSKAISLNGEKNSWMYELGLLYYNQEDYKNAVLLFTNAADKGYPKSSDYRENMGYALLFSGQRDAGEKMLLTLFEKRPDNKEWKRSLAEAFYKALDFQRSLSYCQQLLEQDKNDARALYQAGLNFQKMGEKDKGQALCDKAIQIDPALIKLRQQKMNGGL